MDLQLLQCQVHNKDYAYICTKPQIGNHFLCLKCQKEQQIEQKYLLLIDEITDENNQILQNWPLLEGGDIEKQIWAIPVKESSNYDESLEKIELEVESYFKELKAKLIDKIQEVQQKMTVYIKSFDNPGKIIRDQYIQLSKKVEMQTILKNLDPLESKNAALKMIIEEVIQNEQKNRQILNKGLEKVQQQQTKPNFSSPKLIQDLILGLVDRIDMFVSLDINKINREVIDSIEKKDMGETQEQRNRREVANNALLGQNQHMEMMKSNFSDSQQLILLRAYKGELSICPPTNIVASAVSSFILDNNSAYIFRISFNKSFQESGYVQCGLIEDSEIHTKLPNEGFNGFSTKKIMGKTIIKGKHLSYLSDNYSCIEVRVCVATSEHYFADYPHYNHINQVDTLSRYYKKLDQQKGYRFGIGFWNVCKGLEITINDMIIMNDRTQLSNFKSPLTD